MQALLAAGRLAVGGPLWTLALEHILLRCVDTETQVRSPHAESRSYRFGARQDVFETACATADQADLVPDQRPSAAHAPNAEAKAAPPAPCAQNVSEYLQQTA